MARQTMLLKGVILIMFIIFVFLFVFSLSFVNAQPKVYVISQDWYLSIVDVEKLNIVEDFEIFDPRVPPFETRTAASSTLLVADKDLLFVANEARTYPEGYGGGSLKIMKADLKTKLSNPFFLDPPVSQEVPNLIDDPGTLEGNIRQEITPSEGCPLQGQPRFGNKLYSLGKNRVSELNLADMKRRVVVKDLDYVGGAPSAGGDLWFISQDETSVDLLIADRKTKRYLIRKPLPGEPDLWTILSEKDYSFDVNGQTTDDVAGYKKFVGQLLTIRPPSPLSDPPPEIYKF